MDEKTYAQQLDLLRFQADEIAAARLQPEEEAQVEQDHRRASNAAKLLQLSQAALDLLSENETSLLTQAGIDWPHVAGIAARGCLGGAAPDPARAGRGRPARLAGGAFPLFRQGGH